MYKTLKMLTRYIEAAMSKAKYELLEDGMFYGEIPQCPGVYANADTLEACRSELQEVLQGWIVLGLRMGHDIPPSGQVSLDPETIGQRPLQGKGKRVMT
jgi:predicted RNase H-like HicB family nuclease